MKKISAIIIDDSEEVLSALTTLLKDLFFEEVELINTYNSAMNGLKGILELKPDIVFLDIEMPELSGLELKTMIPAHVKSKIVIISGKEKYALEAIKISVFDYLLKPISILDVKKVIVKFRNELVKHNENVLINGLDNKILVNRHDKTLLIDLENISHIEADSACTIIHYDNKKVSSTKRFNHYESILPPNMFVKIHRSCIVNTQFIQEIVKQDGVGYLILKDGKKIELSKLKKDELINKLEFFVKK